MRDKSGWGHQRCQIGGGQTPRKNWGSEQGYGGRRARSSKSSWVAEQVWGPVGYMRPYFKEAKKGGEDLRDGLAIKSGPSTHQKLCTTTCNFRARASHPWKGGVMLSFVRKGYCILPQTVARCSWWTTIQMEILNEVWTTWAEDTLQRAHTNSIGFISGMKRQFSTHKWIWIN